MDHTRPESETRSVSGRVRARSAKRRVSPDREGIRTSQSEGGVGLREGILGRSGRIPSRLVRMSESALALGISKATIFDGRPIRFVVLVCEISISGEAQDHGRKKIGVTIRNDKQVDDGGETKPIEDWKRSASASGSARG